MKQYRRKLIKFSHYSLCVTIPKNLLDRLNLDRGDEMVIEMRRGKIVMSPAPSEEGDKPAGKAAKNADWEPLPQIKSGE